MHLPDNLRDFPNEFLRWLALVFSNFEIRIIISERSAPLTVVLESRTLVLHPDAGLYGLALGAKLMEHRNLLRSQAAPADATRMDRWLTLKARKLVPQAQQDLSRLFPAIGRIFRGRYKPGEQVDDGLKMVARSVEWQPLRPLSSHAQVPSWHPFEIEGGLFHGLEITGSDDLQWILDGLERMPLQALPGLGEIPCVRIPVSVSPDLTCSSTEQIEEVLANPESKKLIKSLIDCHVRKSEVRVERRHGRRMESGQRIDANYVPQAIVEAMLGRTPRLFRAKASLTEPTFNPDEMLSLFLFDGNDLQDASWSGHRSSLVRFIACLLKVQESLGVDCVVHAVFDRLIELRRGVRVCVQFVVNIKRFEEASYAAAWTRLAQLIQFPINLPGTAANCYHPFSAQFIAHEFERLQQTKNHSWRTLLWWARRGMNEDFQEYRSPEMLMRFAEYIDRVFREMERGLSGTLDSLPSFLPDQDLCQFGVPSGFLKSVQHH